LRIVTGYMLEVRASLIREPISSVNIVTGYGLDVQL
jgi:hypothetical protein